MDGYSVKDAALVLGIPERRVWELVARGVLSSAREGPDGMRVFLQPRSAPEPAAEPRIYRADAPDATPPPNGNGGSHEMSPFRELLTEFRSLTERYGQALLALGEARGEVASLRTRVELLEARMDLRLPSTRPASTVAWEIPGYGAGQEPASEQADELNPDLPPSDELASEAPFAEPVEAGFEPEPTEPMLDVEVPVEPTEPKPASRSRKRRAESRRKKIKGGRSALVGIAEALARADDPTLAALPGGTETAEAMAALQRDGEAGSAEEEAAAELPADATQDVVQDEIEAMVEPVLEPMEEELPELFTEASMPAVSVPAAGLVADADDQLLDEEVDAPDVIEVSYVTLAEEATQAEPAAAEDAQLAAADVLDAPVDAPVEGGVESDVVTTVDELIPTEAPSFEDEAPVEAVIEDADAAPEELTAEEPVVSEDSVAQPPEPQPTGMPAEPEGTHELLAAPDSPYSADVVEPDWFADGDFTWLEAAQAEAATTAPEAAAAEEHAAAAEQTAEAAPMASDDEAPAPDQTMAHDEGFEPSATQELEAEEEARAAIQDAFQEPVPPEIETPAGSAFEEPAQDVFVEPAPEPEAEHAIQDAFSEPALEREAPDPGGELQTQPFEEPAEPAGAEPAQDAIQDAFGEPDLEPMLDQPMAELGAGDEVAGESSVPESSQPSGPPRDASPTAPRGEEELMWLGDEFEAAGIEVAAQGWRSADAASAPSVALDSPTLELTDAELSQLAEDEGWDAGEVEAIRRLLGRPTPADTGEASTGALPDPSAAEAPPAGDAAQPVEPAPSGGGVAPKPESTEHGGSPEPPPPLRHAMSMSDPQWLRGRRGPAATAYRRLRRLFPG